MKEAFAYEVHLREEAHTGDEVTLKSDGTIFRVLEVEVYDNDVYVYDNAYNRYHHKEIK